MSGDQSHGIPSRVERFSLLDRVSLSPRPGASAAAQVAVLRAINGRGAGFPAMIGAEWLASEAGLSWRVAARAVDALVESGLISADWQKTAAGVAMERFAILWPEIARRCV